MPRNKCDFLRGFHRYGSEFYEVNNQPYTLLFSLKNSSKLLSLSSCHLFFFKRRIACKDFFVKHFLEKTNNFLKKIASVAYTKLRKIT